MTKSKTKTKVILMKPINSSKTIILAYKVSEYMSIAIQSKTLKTRTITLFSNIF